MPPSSRPTAPPPAAIALHTPSAFWRSGPSGNVVVMIDRAAGETSAAPRPCTPRKRMSISLEFARPLARLAAVNSSVPPTKSRVRPTMSAARPPSSRKPPKVSVYELITHCRSDCEKCRSRWIDGSATLTIVASRMTMNCARQTSTSTNQRFDSCPVDWMVGASVVVMPSSVSTRRGHDGVAIHRREADRRIALCDRVDRGRAREADRDDVVAASGEPRRHRELLGGRARDAQFGARPGGALGGRGGGVGNGRIRDDHRAPGLRRVGARDRRTTGERQGDEEGGEQAERHTYESTTYDGRIQGRLPRVVAAPGGLTPARTGLSCEDDDRPARRSARPARTAPGRAAGRARALRPCTGAHRV